LVWWQGGTGVVVVWNMDLSNAMIPSEICYQIYSLLVIGFALSSTLLFGMAFSALYGMGGSELVVTIAVITFYGILRLYIPPWDDTIDSLFSDIITFPWNKRKQKKSTFKLWALDQWTFTEKQEKSISSCSCPICLNEWTVGDELVIGRVCGHIFHKDCLHLWLVKHSSCPCCRQDLEISHGIEECKEKMLT